MVMGAVGVIEEHGELNLGLGIPAGGASVLAAAASVHTSRGFSGYRAPAAGCGGSRYAAWRGGAWRSAVPVLLLWMLAVGLHATLLGRSVIALAEPYHPQYPPNSWVPPSAGSKPTPTRTVIASLQMILAASTLVAVALVLHVDCRHDPGAGDGPGGVGLGHGSGVGGASSTAMSMVAVASTSSERGSRV
ncbi:NAD(P)H-quinone oxidoreductase subunit 5, chloroplastic [Frankliniella fusca]|uniref:NAD(P)H-quinone oxidoreductase subunit 5, chloroplastic n=1 Tax=Frankliniella fusca TaxID=407009 RepID=A0AAE1GU50_9NEOP|nr:NAD(P)H-quinone oxidoreductase subunit 5, chloroplastic [Frankliniella fusca]